MPNFVGITFKIQTNLLTTGMSFRTDTSGDTQVINSRRRWEGNSVESKPRIDKHIWGIYIGIIFVSLIELYSASSREVTAGHIMTPLFRHAGLLGIGCLIMIGLQRVHYQVFYKLTWLIVGLSVVAAIYTMFWGDIINGARRSFSLVFFNVQSSELLKFSAALLIAKVLGDGQIKNNNRPDVSNRAVIVVSVAVLIFGAMLIKQGLTNTILLMMISLSLMLISGISWKKFGLVLLVYATLGGGYIGVTSFLSSTSSDKEENGDQTEQIDRGSTRKKRMVYYFSSKKYEEPITSENQQSQYSYIAQANGGIFGVGPGNSRETARLPLAFSDYIYAIIIEDGGLIGGLIVMALYLLLLARAGRIATRCRKAFPTLLVIGMAVFIVYQALFHMAIVTGVFPVSGQPLPFISKGGSSVIISSIALGIMLSVSRSATQGDATIHNEEKGLQDNPLYKDKSQRN